MVDQELEETKMVDGGYNSKSKAPYQHNIFNLRALDSEMFVFFIYLCVMSR